MRYTAAVLAVRDIGASRRFYEELFGLTVFQDYGLNILFDCGLSIEETSRRMDVSVPDLKRLLER